MVSKTSFLLPRRGNSAFLRRCLLIGSLIALLGVIHNSYGQARYYRYVNDEGVRVMSSTIPPEYAQKGYEVIGPNGRVLQKVEPAPPPEDLERVEQERLLRAEYEVLARRYSSVEEILAARERRLAHLDANIAILRGNISNINTQIEELMGRAADFEREGRDIPARIFTEIDHAREELRSTEEMLRVRLVEHDEVHERFDRDIELFKQGRSQQQDSPSAVPR